MGCTLVSSVRKGGCCIYGAIDDVENDDEIEESR